MEMQGSWLSRKGDEVHGYADRYDMKYFYKLLKDVNGPISSGSSPLLSTDRNTLITDKN